MQAPRLGVAHIFRRYGKRYRQRRGSAVTSLQRAVIKAIQICRTAACGGQVEICTACHHQRVHYRCCRNRNCPQCQWAARTRWLDARQAELLNCEYFHLVCTLPSQLAALTLQNRVALCNILFRAVSATLTGIAADPQHLGAKIGFLAILHTWGQQLQFHPHLHCVVTGGGLSPQADRWISCRRGFLLPARVLSCRFRTLFLKQLQRAFDKQQLRCSGPIAELADRDAFQSPLQSLRRKPWVVYSKRPFGGPARVLEHLARYTHRIAIANHRLLSIDNGVVRFRWRDYRNQGQHKVLQLTAAECMRRFLMHIVPPRFHRIRYYGLLAPRFRKQHLQQCRKLLQMPEPDPAESDPPGYEQRYEQQVGESLRKCPECGEGVMLTMQSFLAGDAPPHLDDTS